MAKAYDLLQDNTGDLYFLNGDFVIGESDQQHINDILYSSVGWWKEYPTMGVNILQFQSGSDIDQDLNQAIRVNLEADGFKINNVLMNTDNENLTLDIDAVRI